MKLGRWTKLCFVGGRKMSDCEYEGCDNIADYIEDNSSVCCEECMLRETEEYGRDAE